MATKLFLVWTTLFLSINAAGGWDDFANNLATDLAPILQLFGEQVSLQYLAESTSVLDCIIFAMAPLGVSTAVVSVIRICGNSALKAFIGRAQEGSGVAEVALCSSTGKDIADLYQHGVITRVFGRPHILEVVHAPHEERFNSEDPNASGDLYTFDEYQLTGRGRCEWVKDGSSISDHENMSHSNQFHSQDMLNPNLRLNIGFQRPARWILASLAAFAVALQSSVIVFAIWTGSTRKLHIETGSSSNYALPMTVTGTTVLCFGMFMCALMIEKSTVEDTFMRKLPTKRKSSSEATSTPDRLPLSTLYWIQPGGQVIGDQIFHSFAYSDNEDPLRYYTKSSRSRWENEGKLSWVASALTILGFIIQFVGLRGMHPSVSVYQIGCVLAMSILRASIRTGRFDESKNMASDLASGSNGSTSQEDNASNDHDRLSNSKQDINGHELDCVAFLMAGNRSDSDILRPSERNGKASFSPDDQWSLLPWPTSDICSTNQCTAIRRGSTIGSGTTDEPLTQEKSEAPDLNNAGSLIWRYRARLGRLTVFPASQQWPDSMVKGRSAAAAAARAINLTAALLLPSDLNTRGKILPVAFNCGIGRSKASPDPSNQPKPSDIFVSSGMPCFHLRLDERDYISWRADSHEIEAAVALMAWSQRRCPSSLQIIGTCVPEDISFKIPSHYCLQEWECAGTVFHRLDERRLKFSSISTEYAAHCNEPVAVDSIRNIIYYPQMITSICGWNAVPWERFGTPPELTVYCAHVGRSIDLTCAQDLYGFFLLEFLGASDNALGETDFVKTEEGYGIRNSKVDKLIDGFVGSGLGSKDDAVRCILPIVAASDCPTPVKGAIGAVLKSVQEAIKSERYEDARSELNWLAKLLEYEADNKQVYQWCLLKSCLYRCNRWESHAHEGQGFEKSFLKDIELVKRLRLDSETKVLAHDLFMRLWQMFWFDGYLGLQRTWEQQQEHLSCDLPRAGAKFDYCLREDDPYGALVCLPSFVRKPDGELFKLLLRRKGSSWRLVVQAFLSFEPELTLYEHEGRNALSIAFEFGSVETVRWVLEKLDMLRRTLLLTRIDKDGRTPVHYAIQADQKDTIRALGPEFLRYWHHSYPSRYLEDNFGDLLDLQNAQSETMEDETGGTDGDTVDPQWRSYQAQEKMWRAIRKALKSDE
jgi:hypothetical protein